MILTGSARGLILCWALACGHGLSMAAERMDPATASAEVFFGATNLYTFHLTIAPEQWAIMEEFDQPKDNAARAPGDVFGPGGFRPGFPARGGNRPGIGPGGNGPMMGLEFKKGTASLEFEGQPWGAIRVRFKGNSSFNFARDSLKRSLKLDFNDLEKGRAFFGLTKLNLNNNAMDPSQLREALAYDIFCKGGLPAGRTAFAKVFITIPGRYAKSYTGLYTVVEQVDERFLKARFGTKEGLLMKPERVPGLPYFGEDWTAYTNRMQPKTGATTNDTRRFIEFVKCLNQTGRPSQGMISDFMDVDEYLCFLALQSLLSNLDSPLMTGHNYYLWLHPATRKFIWIPWDLNEAFGGFLAGGTPSEQMNLSVDHPFTSVNRLAERLMETPGIKDRYHAIVRGLLATNFNTTRLFPLIDAMATAIRPALTNDPTVSLAQFDAALSTFNPSETVGQNSAGGLDFRRGGPGGMRRPRAPLKAFLTQRVESVRLQLEGKSEGHTPPEMRPGPNGGPRPAGPPMGPPP
jgi:spore coat protein H